MVEILHGPICIILPQVLRFWYIRSCRIDAMSSWNCWAVFHRGLLGLPLCLEKFKWSCGVRQPVVSKYRNSTYFRAQSMYIRPTLGCSEPQGMG